MTKEDFDFWERAFLAAIDCIYGAPKGVIPRANNVADAALTVWREKRSTVEREHVEKVVTNG